MITSPKSSYISSLLPRNGQNQTSSISSLLPGGKTQSSQTNLTTPSNPSSTTPSPVSVTPPITPTSVVKSDAGQKYVNSLKAPGSPEAASKQQSSDMQTYFPKGILSTGSATQTTGSGTSTGNSTGTGLTNIGTANSPLSSYLRQYQKNVDTVSQSMKPTKEYEDASIRLAEVRSEAEKKKLQGRRDVDFALDAPGGTTAGAKANADIISRRANSELADLAVQENAYANTLNALSGNQKVQAEYAKFLLDSGKAIEVGGSLIDPTTGEAIYEKPQGINEKYGTGAIGEYNFAKENGYKGSFSDYQNEDANRKATAAGIGGLTPAQVNTTINSIAGAFDNEPIVKNFGVLNEAKNFVDSLSDTTVNPVDDQGLIYALAKALDPNSVVREGEYATAQKYAQSLINAYGKSIQQALAGTGFLSEDARKNIKNTINSRYQASKNNYENVKKEYQRQIDDARTGKPRQITDYAGSSSQNIVTAPDGTKVIIVD